VTEIGENKEIVKIVLGGNFAREIVYIYGILAKIN